MFLVREIEFLTGSLWFCTSFFFIQFRFREGCFNVIFCNYLVHNRIRSTLNFDLIKIRFKIKVEFWSTAFLLSLFNIWLVQKCIQFSHFIFESGIMIYSCKLNGSSCFSISLTMTLMNIKSSAPFKPTNQSYFKVEFLQHTLLAITTIFLH